MHAKQGNRASSRGEGEVSWYFPSCGGKLGYILELRWGWPFNLVFVQQRQDSCLVARNTSGFSSRLGRAIGMPLHVRLETQCLFPVAPGILGFLSIFKRGQASSPFEALNSAFDLSCQMNVRTPFKMRQGTRAFSKVSTGHLDLPSSCEMKDEPAFKSLPGNSAFIRVRTSWCLFHLRQHT